MNLLFAINDKFFEGFIATCTSFCVNNPGAHHFYIMYDRLSLKYQKKAMRILNKFTCELNFIDIGTGAFSHERYTSLPRYYSQSINRLLPQLAVPSTVERLLYLDTDVIVNGSLESFYDTDFEENFIVCPAVRRDGQNGGPFWDQEAGVYNMIRIPLAEDELYFNSGVLLLNVARFRTIDITFYDRIVDVYRGLIVFADQDILNIAFKNGTKRIIDRRLNCTIPDNMRLRKGEFRWIQREVIVLHYVVWRKPWMPWRYRNRLFHIFMRYFAHEGRPFSYFYRYSVWYFMKPFHFFKHCWTKALSILRGSHR